MVGGDWMDEIRKEERIWQRVTGMPGGGGGAPGQGVQLREELAAARSRLQVLQQLPEHGGLLALERETMYCLRGLYRLITGDGELPEKGGDHPERGREARLRWLLASMEKSEGRLRALAEHATGNVRRELERIAAPEQQSWHTVLMLLGR